MYLWLVWLLFLFHGFVKYSMLFRWPYSCFCTPLSINHYNNPLKISSRLQSDNNITMSDFYLFNKPCIGSLGQILVRVFSIYPHLSVTYTRFPTLLYLDRQFSLISALRYSEIAGKKSICGIICPYAFFIVLCMHILIYMQLRNWSKHTTY